MIARVAVQQVRAWTVEREFPDGTDLSTVDLVELTAAMRFDGTLAALGEPAAGDYQVVAVAGNGPVGA